MCCVHYTSSSLSAARNEMPVIQSSLNFCLKQLILSHSSISFSKFAITKQVLNSRNLCAVASAESTASHHGGRLGALSSPPVTEEVQRIDVNPPKGTRDFPPEDMRLRNWLFHNFREVRFLKQRVTYMHFRFSD